MILEPKKTKWNGEFEWWGKYRNVYVFPLGDIGKAKLMIGSYLNSNPNIVVDRKDGLDSIIYFPRERSKEWVIQHINNGGEPLMSVPHIFYYADCAGTLSDRVCSFGIPFEYSMDAPERKEFMTWVYNNLEPCDIIKSDV